jgi:hypothetical protein
VTAPVRGVVAALAATEYVALPGPVPVAPAVIVIQSAPAAALHAQPEIVATVTVAFPPSLPIAALVGEMV